MKVFMVLSFRDSVLLFEKITFGKILNVFKVLGSYYYSKFTKSGAHFGLPYSISIEPTTSCNLRCPECPSGLRSFTRPTGMLDKTFFRETIDDLADHLIYLTFYFQGEPYLNPGFLEMVKYASEKRIYTATSTNAHYLDDENAVKTIESGLDRLIISIDGTTQETYQSYRIGGQLERVIEGAKNIIKWKRELKSKTPQVIFQFLVVKPNEHQIDDVIKLGKEIGVDKVLFKTAQVYDYENGNELIPTIDKYSRYRLGKNGKYTIKNKLSNHCWDLWHSCVVTWDGNIVPCCFDKDAQHGMGNLQKDKFRNLWNNESYRNFRTAVLHSRRNIDICSNCTAGTKVWA